MIVSAVLFLFFVFLLFLCLPIRIGASGGYDGVAGAFRGWVRPWAGALGVQARFEGRGIYVGLMAGRRVLFGHTFPPGKKPAKPAPKRAEAEEEGRRPVGERLAGVIAGAKRGWFYFRELRPSAWRFLGRLRRGFQVRYLTCEAVFGTGYPAATGRLYGYILAFSNVVGRRVHVDVEPDFTQARLEGEAALEVSIDLYRLVWAVVCLAVRVGWVWGVDTWRQWRRGRTEAGMRATDAVAGR